MMSRRSVVSSAEAIVRPEPSSSTAVASLMLASSI
jgi:hypothetical protein